MKQIDLISLNIWGGFLTTPLLGFIKQHKDTDILCLQEVYHNAPKKMSTDDKSLPLDILDRIHKLLPDHEVYFLNSKDIKGYGIAIFIKKSFQVVDHGGINAYHNASYPGSGPSHSRDLQWMKCQLDNISFYILNFHGLWNGKGKNDSDERILQSEKIKNFLDQITDPYVLCGDFNLRPDTTSIKILESVAQNLIDQNGITSTRTRYYEKDEKYADYIFTSNNMKVQNFVVMKDEVSDHSPLYLSFTP
jgi:endonuclease/exonuclease/phosphatase family metal-dependent hydrolase